MTSRWGRPGRDPGGLPGTRGTGAWEGGVGMLPSSPSLNVALQEVGFTFLGFFMLSNSPSLNVALREVGFTFF